MSKLELIKGDLRLAWNEYVKDDPAALGTAILAMNNLVNHLIAKENEDV